MNNTHDRSLSTELELMKEQNNELMQQLKNLKSDRSTKQYQELEEKYELLKKKFALVVKEKEFLM